MRLTLLGLAAALASSAALAQELRVAQSPVTLSASFSRTGTTASPVDRLKDDDINVNTPLDRVRYGNTELLRTFFATFDSAEPRITDPQGWSLVAVWANWPYVGNSYKFFAAKGAERREIPATLLKLDFIDAFVGKNVKRKDGAITSGTEKHKILALLSLGPIGAANDGAAGDGPRVTSAGLASGLVSGTGSYTRPSGAAVAIYRPIVDTFTGYGYADNPDGQPDDILTVTLKVGASSAVAASLYASSTPSAPSDGPEAGFPSPPASGSTGSTGSTGLTKVGSGGLILGSGSVVSLNQSGTLTLGGSGSLTPGAGSGFSISTGTISTGTIGSSGTISAGTVLNFGSLPTISLPGANEVTSAETTLFDSLGIALNFNGGGFSLAPDPVLTTTFDPGSAE